MRHFKTSDNIIRAIDAGQEFLIRPDWIELSPKELEDALAPTPEQVRQTRIAELKLQLQETDYKVMPDYDKPNDDVKRQRQAWRDELRSLGG